MNAKIVGQCLKVFIVLNVVVWPTTKKMTNKKRDAITGRVAKGNVLNKKKINKRELDEWAMNEDDDDDE